MRTAQSKYRCCTEICQKLVKFVKKFGPWNYPRGSRPTAKSPSSERNTRNLRISQSAPLNLLAHSLQASMLIFSLNYERENGPYRHVENSDLKVWSAGVQLASARNTSLAYRRGRNLQLAGLRPFLDRDLS